MRPVIPDELVDRIEQVEDQHGYESAAEYARDAVRRMLERHERQHRIEQLKETAADNLKDVQLSPEDFIIQPDGSGNITVSLTPSARERETMKTYWDNYETDS